MQKRMLLVLVFLCISLGAQEHILMINYGPNASTAEGDDDYRQVFYIELPTTLTDSVFLRIFDADCGGRVDAVFGEYDSKTRFRLLGGSGIYTPELDAEPGGAPLDSGIVLQEAEFGIDSFLDDKWFTFAGIEPGSGETVGDKRYFKLFIEGLSGDDGNLFDLAVSMDDKHNQTPEGAQLLCFKPTLRVPREGIYAEIRFWGAENINRITVHNFDLANGDLSVETAFRTKLRIPPSQQDEWAQGDVILEPLEKNRWCAVMFRGGAEIPNDASFYLSTPDDQMIPIVLPVYVRGINRHPVPAVETKILADCQTVVFDGSFSTDADGDVYDIFWDFGDGQSDQGVRVAHTYAEQKKYSVGMIVTDSSGYVGNSGFKEFDVTVNQPPSAQITGPNLGVPGQEYVFDASQSRDVDGEIVKIIWNFDDGQKAEGTPVSHAFQQPGVYQVTLRVQDNSDSPCNTDIKELEVLINAPPVADIGEDQVVSAKESIPFDGRRSSDSDGDIVAYAWSFGDGETGTGQMIDHAYSEPGRYLAVLQVRDNTSVSNNTAADSCTITVNFPPVAEGGPDMRVSAKERLAFSSVESFDRDGEIINVSWDFGDGESAEGEQVFHAFENPGLHTVTLTVQDNSNTRTDQTSDSVTVIVNYPPVAVVGPDTLVTASLVTFDGTQSSDEDGEIVFYRWDFGDGGESMLPKPEHVYREPGTYTVQLSVTDNSGTKTNQAVDSKVVTVNALPIADAGMIRTAAPMEAVQFSGTESLDPDGEIQDYFWEFGDDSTAGGAKVSHVYQKPGLYSVLLRVQDNTGHSNAIDFDAVTVRINAAPVAIAREELFAAPGDTVVFDGSLSYDTDGSITSYLWDFDSESSDTKNAIVKQVYAKPGIYSATLTVLDDSGTENNQDQTRVSVYVNHAPEARPGEDIVTCEKTIEFNGAGSVDADGNPLTYSWDFGDGSQPKQGVRVVHTYEKAGTFPVILTVNDGSGLANSKNAASLTVTINEPPLAKAGEDKTICAGDLVLFDAAGSLDPEGGLMKYYWDFGDSTSAEGLNPVKTFNEGGAYQVTLTVIDDSGLPCNSDMDQMVVLVAESPVAEAGEDMTVCANAPVKFDGTKSRDFDGVVNNYSWDFGDGNAGGGATPTHVYLKPGSYRVLLTITGDQVGDCDNTDADELTVTVVSAPIAAFSAPKKVAKNLPASFDASVSSGEGSEIVVWRWDFGDGQTAEGESVTHSYDTFGTYFVSLTVETQSETGCNNNLIQDFIVVNEAPQAAAGDDLQTGLFETVVFNARHSFDADGSIVDYEWDFGDGNSASGIEAKHAYSESGSYSVILRVTDNTALSNNSDTDTMAVHVNATPIPAIQSVDRACVGDSLVFDGSGSVDPDGEIQGVRWDFGDGKISETLRAVHVYTTPGTYQAVLSVADGSALMNAQSIGFKTLKINLPPVAKAGPDRVTCPGLTVSLDGSSSYDQDGVIVEYSWDFGDGTSGTGLKTSHIYEQAGEYQLRLTVKDDSGTPCGQAEDVAVVRVNAAPVADAGADMKGYAGGAQDALVFDGTGSSDPDGDALTYLWFFEDGLSKSGPKVFHAFAKPGIYTVRLEVSDGSGNPCAVSVDAVTVEIQSR